jgi:putative membrane protein
MALDIPLVPVLMTTLVGALTGCLTGLVPGLHSNNAASLFGANPGFLIAIATLGLIAPGDGDWALAASCGVTACAVAHTVTNIVPSIYLAIPEGDTALSVLPGHRMVMSGRGEEAVRISVTSSLVSLTLALALVIPLRWLMGPPFDLYAKAGGWLGAILLGVSFLMMLLETDKEVGKKSIGGWKAGIAALGVFLTAGALGHIAMNQAQLVGPLFIGLFGVPVIIIAMMGDPKVTIDVEPPDGKGPELLPVPSMVMGSLMGCLVGWFPGISAAQATILAVPRKEGAADDLEGARRFIAGVSAVNTANALFVLVALATLLRVRSGAAVAINALMAWEQPPWSFGTSPGMSIGLLMLAAAAGGFIAAPVTIGVGRMFQGLLPYLSHRVTLGALLASLVLISYWSGGAIALPVMGTAAALGMVPPRLGLMRVHLMGVVSLPLVMGFVLT